MPKIQKPTKKGDRNNFGITYHILHECCDLSEMVLIRVTIYVLVEKQENYPKIIPVSVSYLEL